VIDVRIYKSIFLRSDDGLSEHGPRRLNSSSEGQRDEYKCVERIRL